jgi:hypothetical protein
LHCEFDSCHGLVSVHLRRLCSTGCLLLVLSSNLMPGGPPLKSFPFKDSSPFFGVGLWYVEPGCVAKGVAFSLKGGHRLQRALVRVFLTTFSPLSIVLHHREWPWIGVAMRGVVVAQLSGCIGKYVIWRWHSSVSGGCLTGGAMVCLWPVLSCCNDSFLLSLLCLSTSPPSYAQGQRQGGQAGAQPLYKCEFSTKFF